MHTSIHLKQLAEQACPGGGWGYFPGQDPHLEPTCLALLALASSGEEREKHSDVLSKGQAWLQSCRGEDGVYRLSHGRPEAIWHTALVLYVQITLGEPTNRVNATATTLLSFEGRQLPEQKIQDLEISDVDGKLIGWPWAEGNFSWVEPTAWACLGLQQLGQGKHPRVQEGLRLLLDRALDQGGINYGNRRIFGISLDPIPTPTALMLLALQGQPEDPRITSAVKYLQQCANTNGDLEHLCWARLALDRYRTHEGVEETLTNLAERIREAYQAREDTPWLRPAPLREALTALAFNVEQNNPFALAYETAQPELTPGKRNPTKPSLGERLRSTIQGLALRAVTQLKPLQPKTDVHIAPITDYNADIPDVLKRQYELFRERVPLADKRVVLKPNLVEYHRDKVINTHPHVVAGVIELCKREGAAEVIVAEGPGHWRNVEYLVEASGLGDVLRHHQVPFVDLNHDDPIKQLNPSRLTQLPHLYLTRTIVEADVVISLPKLKTHHWAIATLSLKNLFGTLPGICYGWPKNELHWRGIDNSIVDIAATRMPDLAIVDGIVGMEGDGPLNGVPRAAGVLVMGDDLLAVDATCCRLMQLDPEKIPYLVMGHQQKLGLLKESHIQQVGETIAQRAQPFDTVEYFRPVWMGRSA